MPSPTLGGFCPAGRSHAQLLISLARELLTHVAKHAQAVARGHIGLASAIARVEVIGGTLDITSSTSDGAVVRLALPAG